MIYIHMTLCMYLFVQKVKCPFLVYLFTILSCLTYVCYICVQLFISNDWAVTEEDNMKHVLMSFFKIKINVFII